MVEQLSAAISSVNASLALCDACTINYARARLLKSRLQTINQLLSSYSTSTGQSTFSTYAITNLLDGIALAKQLLSQWAQTGPSRVRVVWRTLQSQGFSKSFTMVLQHLDASMPGLTGSNGAIFQPTDAGVIQQAVSVDTHNLVQSIMEAAGNDVTVLETIVVGELGGSLELLVNMLADLGCDTRPLRASSLIEHNSLRKDDDVHSVTHSDIISSAGSLDELMWETEQILAFNKKMRERGLKGRPLPHPCIAKDALVMHESSSVCIGAGAVADVFRATHSRKHDVAIKMARTAGDRPAGILSPLTQRDLLREAQLMCKLSSPHIVRCFGIIPEMNNALVMEYMEDGSLQEYLQRLKANVGVASHEPFVELGSERLQLALDAACAVEYLHTCHTLGGAVVHGDLKTGALLVHGGRAKLANFGCTVTPSTYTRSLTTATANSASNSASNSSSDLVFSSASNSVFNSVSSSVPTSASNSVFNSVFNLVSNSESNSAPISTLNSAPNSASNSMSISASNPSKVFPGVYHAPEQLRALCASESQDSPPRNTQTDVYSLGAVLYEIMTCCTPFSHLGMSLNDPLLLQLIASGKKHPRFTELQDTSPDLTAMIKACMAVNPEQRPGVKKVTQCLSQLLRSHTPMLAASQRDSSQRDSSQRDSSLRDSSQPDDFASSMTRPSGGHGRLDRHSKLSCRTLNGERSRECLYSQHDGSLSSSSCAHPPSSPWGSKLYEDSRPSTSTRPPAGAHTGVSPLRASDTSCQPSSTTHTGVSPLRASVASSQQSSIPHTGVVSLGYAASDTSSQYRSTTHTSVSPLRASNTSSQRSSTTHTGVDRAVPASDASTQYRGTTYSGVSPLRASDASSQRSSTTPTGVSPLRASDTSSQRSSTTHTGVNRTFAASDASPQYLSTTYTGVSPLRASAASCQRSSTTHTGVSPLRASDTSSQLSSTTHTGVNRPFSASDASSQYHSTIYTGVSPLRSSDTSSQQSSIPHTRVSLGYAASDTSSKYRSTTDSGVSPLRSSDASSQRSRTTHTGVSLGYAASDTSSQYRSTMYSGVSPLRASDTSSQRSSTTHTGVNRPFSASDASSQYHSTPYAEASPLRSSDTSSQQSSIPHTRVSLGYAASDTSSQHRSTTYSAVSPLRSSDTSSQQSRTTHTGVSLGYAASDTSSQYCSTTHTGVSPLRSSDTSSQQSSTTHTGVRAFAASDASSQHPITANKAATGTVPFSTLRSHSNSVNCVHFSPCGSWLASASDDMTVRVWHLGHATPASVTQSAARAPPQIIDTAKILHHNPTARKGSFLLRACTAPAVTALRVKSVAFAPVNQPPRLASGSTDGAVRVWACGDSGRSAVLGERTRRNPWSLTHTLTEHKGSVSCVSFASSGTLLASGSWDRTVRVMNTDTMESGLQVLKGHTDKVTCVCFLPGDLSVASASQDGTVRLWDTLTGQRTRCFQHCQQTRTDVARADKDDVGCMVSSVCCSPTSPLLASAACDGCIRMWDPRTGACATIIKAHDAGVKSLCFSRDGMYLTSASCDQSAKIFEISTGRCLQVLRGHNGGVNWVAFSPDARVVASASYDATVCLWANSHADPQSATMTWYTEI